MNKAKYLSIVILGFLAGLMGAYAAPLLHYQPPSTGTKAIKESVYDRVMRTQTIRCGYGAWPPFIIKDPNSGQLSGIFYDYMTAMGQALHLKIEWPVEVGTSDFTEALKDGRIDGVCASVWPNAARAREIDFVRPIYYSGMYVYARADDRRFDNDISKINDPSVMIVTQDGEMAALIADSDFPKAKALHLPQLASISEFFVNIAMQKADVTFANPSMFALYDAQNQGKLRRVPAKTPVRVFGNTIAIARGQDEFRRMLDLATEELISNGTIEKILTKYGQTPETLLRVMPPYETGPAANSPPQ